MQTAEPSCSESKSPIMVDVHEIIAALKDDNLFLRSTIVGIANTNTVIDWILRRFAPDDPKGCSHADD